VSKIIIRSAYSAVRESMYEVPLVGVE